MRTGFGALSVDSQGRRARRGCKFGRRKGYLGSIVRSCIAWGIHDIGPVGLRNHERRERSYEGKGSRSKNFGHRDY